MRAKFKDGDLARCGAELVTVVEVRGAWATVKAFGNPVQCDRLVADLRRCR